MIIIRKIKDDDGPGLVGPAVRVSAFWSRYSRTWIAMYKDANDYQVGDAEYAPNKAAIRLVRERMEKALTK